MQDRPNGSVCGSLDVQRTAVVSEQHQKGFFQDLNCDKGADMHKQIKLDATYGFIGNKIKLNHFLQCTLMHLCL